MTDGTGRNGAPVALSGGLVDAYAQFSEEYISLAVVAGNAYANKQPQAKYSVTPQCERLAERVVPGAEFYPAHPSSFTMRGRPVKFQYFIIHRPAGINPRNIGAQANVRTLAQLVARVARGTTKERIVADFIAGNTAGSSHFVLGFDGTLVQMIDLLDVSQHVLGGRPHPRTGVKIYNSNSVGIELEGFVQPYKKEDIQELQQFASSAEVESLTKSGFSAEMKEKLAWLLRWFHDNADFGLPLDRDHVLGHSEIDPGRRTDPGRNFLETLDEVLERAKFLPPISQKYQEPVNLRLAGEMAVQRYGQTITRVAAAIEMEKALSMAASMQGTVRAAGISATDRAAYFSAATQHAATWVAARQAEIADKKRAETQSNNTL